jgi:hypothetical protein
MNRAMSPSTATMPSVEIGKHDESRADVEVKEYASFLNVRYRDVIYLSCLEMNLGLQNAT